MSSQDERDAVFLERCRNPGIQVLFLALFLLLFIETHSFPEIYREYSSGRIPSIELAWQIAPRLSIFFRWLWCLVSLVRFRKPLIDLAIWPNSSAAQLDAALLRLPTASPYARSARLLFVLLSAAAAQKLITTPMHRWLLGALAAACFQTEATEWYFLWKVRAVLARVRGAAA